MCWHFKGLFKIHPAYCAWIIYTENTRRRETAGNNSDFPSLCPSTPSLCAWVRMWQTKRNIFLYIWRICSQCYCSSISHHFIQFHAAEWDNADIIRFFSPHSIQSLHRENSCVMDRNAGRQHTVLTQWKCKISYIHFRRWLPNYTLAVRVTCHLMAATILSVQQREPISVLFNYYGNHMLFLHDTAPTSTMWAA